VIRESNVSEICVPLLTARIDYLSESFLTLLVPPDFGGASEKCQGEF
jgi:hypothetical protein